MEETIDTSQMNQTTLQSLLGESTPSLIPESLVTTLTVGFIVLNVLGVLFFIFFVINLIRKWKVESAVLHMQKDLAEIKTQLANQSVPVKQEEPVVVPKPVEPASENKVIAESESSDRDDTSTHLS